MMFNILLIVLGSTIVQAEVCTLTSFEEVPSLLEECDLITINDLTVPAAQTLDLQLKFGTSVVFNGSLTFDIFYQNERPLLKISGRSITVTSTEYASIDGNGQEYWDGQGTQSTLWKPVLFEINAQDSVFNDIYIINCPQNCVKISGSNRVIINGWNIDVSYGFENDIGVDTHGFTIANSSEITIENANIVNQGDCIAVNQGSNYYFENITCQGSQGLTVRPEWVGEHIIRNVTFKNCSVFEGQTGIRVVTSPHQPEGWISDIIYDNINVRGILFRGIDIRQDLNDEGRPLGNIPIYRLDISNVTGNMTDKYVRAVYIWCGESGCEDWKWSNIDIKKAEVENACNFMPNNWSCW